ncbi:hypothetical protein C8R45DRAFT_1068612 [Mycena sanguinolenta]|nr:hypothetical protein C8R45DRAFT_1068612 [Mycena sanguinolenta]
MSVRELHERIAKLDIEINTQKKLLKKLEHDKSLIQGQINNIFDPVARLPLEISSQIFLRSLPTWEDVDTSDSDNDPYVCHLEPRAHRSPMLLLSICNTWTAIALSTPALWSSIEISFPCPPGFTELLPIWLHRTRSHPLSVTLCGDFYNANPAISAIWQHGGQLEHLTVYDTREGEGDEAGDSSADSDDAADSEHKKFLNLFNGTIPGPLPLLKTLTISNWYHCKEFSESQILQLLRLAPGIVDCHFELVPFHVHSASQKLVHPSIRWLTFGQRDQCQLITHLVLPALEVLSVWIYNHDLLFRFFKRSAPPLRELVLRMGSYSPAKSTPLRRCLGLIPSLVRLEMNEPTVHIVTRIFASLAETPSLLPKLHTVVIDFRSDIEESCWRNLLRMVSIRRIELRVLGYHVKAPPADILDAFKELLADGVEIHIGTPNFLVS